MDCLSLPDAAVVIPREQKAILQAFREIEPHLFSEAKAKCQWKKMERRIVNWLLTI